MLLIFGTECSNPKMKVGPLSSDRTSTETVTLKFCAGGARRVERDEHVGNNLRKKNLRGRIRDPGWDCDLACERNQFRNATLRVTRF